MLALRPPPGYHHDQPSSHPINKRTGDPGGLPMSPLSRRDFTRQAALAGAATALSSSRVLGANDRVRLGFIGLGNRGDQVLDGFLAHKDAEVVAVCDLYQPYLDFAAKKIGGSPKQYHDYRK